MKKKRLNVIIKIRNYIQIVSATSESSTQKFTDEQTEILEIIFFEFCYCVKDPFASFSSISLMYGL